MPGTVSEVSATLVASTMWRLPVALKIFACSAGLVELEEVKAEDLPEEMRDLTPEERKKVLDEKAAERKKIETEIAALSKKRDEFVAKEMERRALEETDSFDSAVRGAIREQAAAKGFVFAQ